MGSGQKTYYFCDVCAKEVPTQTDLLVCITCSKESCITCGITVINSFRCQQPGTDVKLFEKGYSFCTACKDTLVAKKTEVLAGCKTVMKSASAAQAPP